MSTAVATTYLADAVAIGFVVLGVATAIGWLRRRDQSLGFLALAIVCLSLVVTLSRIQLFAGPVVPYTRSISLVAFLASGYALFRFRGRFLPLHPKWHVSLLAVMVAGGAIEIFTTALHRAGGSNGPLGTLGLAIVLVTWAAAVGDPTIRFWLASRELPAVQRWRLRALSLGLGALVVLIVVTVFGSPLVAHPIGQLVTQLVVLLIIPLLYVSFSPPPWLRRAWRASEEEGARRVMDEILLRSEDRSHLADAALGWAMRLVGAEAAAIVDGDGTVEACHGVAPRLVPEIAAGTLGRPIVIEATVGAASRTVMRVPIVGARGTGSLVLIAGSLTPVFGSEELARVAQFASALGPAFDRFRLIAELQETNSKLAEASRHKSAFLANMSHELRTPLNAILGFSELLIDDVTFEFDLPTRHGFLEQIHSSGQHLLSLINDILDLSKVEAGQMELRTEAVVIPELVQQVIDTVEAIAGKKRIHIAAKTSRAGTIVADAGKIRQMLLNLVSNAIKFTPEGGRVTITARRTPAWIEISVIDTGIGIAKTDQERVFRQFEQIDSGVSRQQQGTGLGLTLTKRFAELHGGSLELRSKPGHGSSFTIHLPQQPSLPSTHSRSLSAFASTERSSKLPLVLVVEDDPQAAELLVRHLNRGGFRTEVASDGAQAVLKARELQPAAITLDVLLPKLDGWTVLSHLGRDEATKRIPVLVVSVVDDPELGLALGAIDYMVKPVDAKDLLDRIRRLQFRKDVVERGVRLLIVDDQEANRSWLKTVLEPAGYEVIAAKDGREALELVLSRKPDLVLLDLVMPEMSGFDVVEAMSAQDHNPSVPIVIITSKDLTEAEKQMLSGRVAATLGRASTGATDLIALLDQVTGEPVHR